MLVKTFTIIVFTILILSSSGTSEAACTFRSTPTAMNFGNLNPANNTDATATSTVTIRCQPPGLPSPTLYTLSDDSGLNSIAPGQPRMRNTTNMTVYLPYSFIYTNSGTIPLNTNVIVTFTGTVRAVDYQNAWVGNYSDTVTVTINP